eukprot:gene15120-16676_t
MDGYSMGIKTPDYSHLKNKCFEDVYEPAEDSFLMMDALESKIDCIKKRRPVLCLEIGTGSGVLSAFLASALGNSCCFIATDINQQAVLCAKETSLVNNTDINCILDNLSSSLAQRLRRNVDVVLFNPPYVVTPSDEIGGQSIEAAWAGGRDGREVIDKFLPQVGELLSENGVLYMVLIDKNKPDEVREILEAHGLFVDIILKRKAGIENLLSPVIDKSHAVIEYEDAENSFVIRDLNTPHGTYVNECRVQNSAVRLANGDVIRFGFNGPLFEVKIVNDYAYPPSQPRSHHQAWDNSIGQSTYNETSSRDITHLPYLPLPSGNIEPEYSYASAVTSLPYPPAQSQTFLESRHVGSTTVMPRPPVRARPTSAGPTPRSRPLPPSGDYNSMHSTGGWQSSRGHHELSAEENANEMEQKLLKMGDELSRLASYEAECHRKDAVIVSLRNEISDLKASAHLRQDATHSFDVSSANLQTRTQHVTSHQTEVMLENMMKEKREIEKQSAHKLALLQNQIYSKNKEITKLEDKLNEIMSEKWPAPDPDASTNTIASLKSSLARKDLQIAQLQVDVEKANKQKVQTASLVNTLQRESSAKDNLIHKTRNESDKLRRDVREKDSQISSLSAKLTKQKASKEVEKDFQKKEDDIRLLRQKLTHCDNHIKEKNSIIRNLETDIENLKRAFDDNRQNDISLQKELQNMRVQFVEKERADKSIRVELKEYQMKAEKFRKKVLSSLLKSRALKPNRDLNDEDLINAIQHVSEDSLALHERTNQFTEAEDQRNNLNREEERCKRLIERFLDSSEKRLLRNGRRCEVLEDELRSLQDIDVTESLLWFKEVLCNIMLQEKAWQQEIEHALEDGGMSPDKGKKEPAQLIKKIFEKIKKKKEKINNLKLRLKAVESEHGESMAKFREKIMKETEDEVTKAVEKLKRDEQMKIQNVIAECRKREEQKIAEAVETERKIFEREFGNLTDLHKQLGQSQLTLDEHKNKSVTFQDQILQLKFSMEKAQQSEVELKKEIEERDVNHAAQLKAINKEKEDLKQRFIDEVNVFREQSHQYSLTIVALEDKLLKMNKSRKKTDQENYFYKQSKDSATFSGRSSPKRSISRPTSPRKPLKRDVSTATDFSLINQSSQQTKAEVQRLENVIHLLRKEASESKRSSIHQSDVIANLKRDLARSSAKLSDMTGELDDTQKQKIEELRDRIRKQDEELFTQRKQLVELSNLVEQQKIQLLKQDDKIKEQKYVTHAQEEKLKDKGNEIVSLLEHQEAEREEYDTEQYITDKKALTASTVNVAGSRCLGEKHEQIIQRQKEALTEMRLKMRELEQFKPPLPSQHAALQQISAMKRELTDLRSQLTLRDEEMSKDETQLQSEARLSRELLGSINQELAMEKSAQREFREALDLSEQNYVHLVRTICSMLDMEAPLSSTTIIHLPKEERDRVIMERSHVLEKIIEKISILQDRLSRRETLLGGYENDLTQLRDTEELAGRKSTEVLTLTNTIQSKQNEIDCLREALSRERNELDQQKRLNKSMAQRKVFKMDLDRQLELEPKPHSCYKDEFKKSKEESKKRKQAEKLKRKSYEVESLKKELRFADRELNETAAKLYELEQTQPRTSRHDSVELDTEPVLEDLWKHT